MESGRRKRKMGNEEEEEEEEKVEKFFALIKSTREMRERLMNVPNRSKEEEEKKKKKKKQEEKAAAAVSWNPTFQPEDFIQDNISNSKNPSNSLPLNHAGPSSNTAQAQEEETKEGGEDSDLDLKLSL